MEKFDKKGIKIEDNLDFHNIICNNCIHKSVCKLVEKIREFNFLKISACKEYMEVKEDE